MPGMTFDSASPDSQRGQQKDESRNRPRNANIEQRAPANRSRSRMRMNAPNVPVRLWERQKVGQARVEPVIHAREIMAEFMRQSEWSAESAKTAGPANSIAGWRQIFNKDARNHGRHRRRAGCGRSYTACARPPRVVVSSVSRTATACSQSRWRGRLRRLQRYAGATGRELAVPRFPEKTRKAY